MFATTKKVSFFLKNPVSSLPNDLIFKDTFPVFV